MCGTKELKRVNLVHLIKELKTVNLVHLADDKESIFDMIIYVDFGV